jgi:iron complex transport system substrate-binding protein
MAARAIPRSLPRSLRLFLIALAVLAIGCSSAAPTAAPIEPGATSIIPTSAPPTSVEPSAAPVFPVTLTDDEGTQVTIPAEPQKIVSLTPATTETLFAIGAGSRIVGKVQDPANYPPDAAAIPEVATFAGVDVEKIIASGADLVVSGGSGLTQGDAVTQLRAAHIPVVVSYPTSIAGALRGIKLIGTAVGLQGAANTLADQMQAEISALTRIASTAPDQPRLFYEIDVTGGIFTPPANSIYGEMFLLAGSKPIAGDASYSISLENLVAADPEVILLGDAAYGATADAVKARAGWEGMTAVKNGKIVAVDDIVITRPGPRLVQGLFDLVTAIHPGIAIDVPGMSFPAPAPSVTPS